MFLIDGPSGTVEAGTYTVDVTFADQYETSITASLRIVIIVMDTSHGYCTILKTYCPNEVSYDFTT